MSRLRRRPTTGFASTGRSSLPWLQPLADGIGSSGDRLSGGAMSNSESYINGVSSGLARVGPVVLMVLSPLLLRPELFPGALPVTLGAVTIAIVLAILAQGRDRWMAMLIGGLAFATLLGWQRASNAEAALPYLCGLAFGLFAMTTVASWSRTPLRLAMAAALYLLAGIGVLTIGRIIAGISFAVPYNGISFADGVEIVDTGWLSEAVVRVLPRADLRVPDLIVDRFVNRNAFGGTALLFVPVGFALILATAREYVWHRPLRWLGAAVALLGSVALVYSQSRTALVAILVTVFVFVVLHRRTWWLKVMLPSLLVVMLAHTLNGCRATTAAQDQGLMVPALSSAVQRIDIWRQGVDHLRESPWRGIGLNEFRYVYKSAGSAADIAHAHNIFLQIALDLGLVGLSFYVALIGTLLYRAERAARGPDLLARRIACGAGLALTAVHVFGLGDAISLGAKVGLFQWLGAGLVLAASRIQEEYPRSGS